MLIILGLFRFSEALAWTTIFPYVFFMMQSFLPTNSPNREANAAALASLTVALFTFGEFVMGIVWAKVSDRIGRKPTLMIGVVGGCVSALAFGLSTSLWMALAARTFGGLINPNVSVISACVGEMVKRKTDQGKAFSVVPFLRGLGSLIGPVIGGHLADPVRTLPSLFHEGSVWESYPYLLPNLIVVLFIAFSGLLGFFVLEETHPHHQNNRNTGLEICKWICDKAKGLLGQVDPGHYTTLSADEDTTPLRHADEEIELEEELGETASSQAISSDDISIPSAYSRQVILQVLALSILAFHKVSSDIIIPMFLATESQDSLDRSKRDFFKFRAGFGMAPPSISNVLLTQAVVAIVAQVLIVPKVITHWGALKTFRGAMFVFPWMYCLTPFTARLIHPFSTIAILVDLWLKGVLVGLGYVASAILLTNTAPSPLHLATVNGLAASLGCLARSIGAGVSGSMFMLGLKDGYIGLPFWTLGSIAAAGALLSCFLRDEP